MATQQQADAAARQVAIERAAGINSTGVQATAAPVAPAPTPTPPPAPTPVPTTPTSTTPAAPSTPSSSGFDAINSLQSFGDTAQGQDMANTINTLNNQIASGTLSPEEAARVQAQADAVKAQYDQLIAQAEQQKTQGMAKDLVAAGQRGGLMNTQFAGLSAVTPTVGGDFVGQGGELNRIRSEYDLNISNLKARQIQAVTEAQAAAREAERTGKKEDLNAAIDAYNMAKSLHDEHNDLVREKVEALAEYEAKQQEFKQYQRETASGTIEAMVAAGLDPAEIPEESFAAIDTQGGFVAGTAKGLMEVAARERMLQEEERGEAAYEREIDQAASLNALLRDLPVGQTVTIDGVKYNSLNVGKLTTSTETEPDGDVWRITFNEDTQEVVKTYVGNFGNKAYTDITSNEGAVVRVFDDGSQQILFDTRQPNGGVAEGGLISVFPEGSTSPFTRPNDPMGDRATECGAWVNDVTGLGVGNTLESKLNKCSPEITAENAQIGDVFVQRAGTTGHIGIINGISTVNGETYYTVSESNWEKKPGTGGKVGLITHTRQIKASEVLGFARPGFKQEDYNFGTDSLSGLTFGDQKTTGSGSDFEPLIKEIDGVDKQWDPDTQTWITPPGMDSSDSGSSTPSLSTDDIKKTTEAKKLSGIVTLNQAVSDYRNLIEEYGSAGAFQPGQRQKLQSAKEAINVAIKAAEDLGALQAPDIELVKRMIPDVTEEGFLNALYPNVFRASRALSTLDQVTSQYASKASDLYDLLLASGENIENDSYVKELASKLNLADSEDTYSSLKAELLPGEILVEKQDGTIVAIPSNEFDQSKYTKL